MLLFFFRKRNSSDKSELCRRSYKVRETVRADFGGAEMKGG